MGKSESLVLNDSKGEEGETKSFEQESFPMIDILSLLMSIKNSWLSCC